MRTVTFQQMLQRFILTMPNANVFFDMNVLELLLMLLSDLSWLEASILIVTILDSNNIIDISIA